MIVRTNPAQELSEFYPPPYNFLAPRVCPACGLRHPVTRGMGDTSSQVNSIVTTGLSTSLGILTSLHAVIGGVALAGPVGAAIAAGIAVVSLIASLIGHGCGSSCIIASNDANKIAPLLQQNLGAYLSAPVHYASLQSAALNNFNTIWQALVTACSDPSLGAAGQRCISDRQQGSCKYKTSPGGWQNGQYIYPGANNSGSACWNWFIGYHDPIANDPTVVPDPTPGMVSASSAQPTSTNAQPSVTAGGNAPSNGAGSPQPIFSLPGFNLSSLIWPAAIIGGGLLVVSLVD